MKRELVIKKDGIEIQTLLRKDPGFERIVYLVDDITLELSNDYFATLIDSIISQQLSIKAAATIYNRFKELCGEVIPENIVNLQDESMREVGISYTKIKYIKDLCEKVITGAVDLGAIDNMEDEAVVKSLTQVKGIGKWTAQMFLIFSLGRQDVWAVDDLGLKRAVKWLEGYTEYPKPSEMELIGEKWKPFRTAASLYLWRALKIIDAMEKDVRK